jgi:hypothetical protein
VNLPVGNVKSETYPVLFAEAAGDGHGENRGDRFLNTILIENFPNSTLDQKAMLEGRYEPSITSKSHRSGRYQIWGASQRNDIEEESEARHPLH